jgi:hypothetical protein
MYLLWSFHSVGVMPGNGRFMISVPFWPGGSGLLFSSTTSTSTPGRGTPADPGFVDMNSRP